MIANRNQTNRHNQALTERMLSNGKPFLSGFKKSAVCALTQGLILDDTSYNVYYVKSTASTQTKR